WRPGVAPPNFLNHSIAIDQRSREPMGNSASFILPVNGKRASERIDLFSVSRCKAPDFGIGMMKRGGSTQDFRRIVIWIQRDADQPRLRRHATAGFDRCL